MIQEVCTLVPKEEGVLERLEQSLGLVPPHHPLGMEKEYEDRFNGRFNFFHPDKWYSAHSIFTHALKLTGLYRIGTKNAERIQVRRNYFYFSDIPKSFAG